MASQSTKQVEAISQTAKDEITAHNAEESPLLRLPAELRFRIYEYVLGGLEIFARPWDHARCRARISDCDVEMTPVKSPKLFLLSCRQVNAEARLLPFLLNDFDFSQWDTFAGFLDSLKDDQRGSICNVQLRSDCVTQYFADVTEFWRFGPCHDKYSECYLPFQRLEGLKCIVWECSIREQQWFPETVIKAIARQLGGPADLEVIYKTCRFDIMDC